MKHHHLRFAARLLNFLAVSFLLGMNAMLSSGVLIAADKDWAGVGNKTEFELSPNDASVVAWSPDGNQLAVSGILNPYVRVFDLQSKKLVMTLRKVSGGSLGLAYSPRGRYLAAGNGFVDADPEKISVRIWDAQKGTLLRNIAGPFARGGGANGVKSLAFSPDDRFLAVAYMGNVGKTKGNFEYLFVYDMNTGEVYRSFGDVRTGFSTAPILFTSDGRYLIDGNSEGDIKVWDIASGEAVKIIVAHPIIIIRSMAHSPDGRLIVSGTDTDAVPAFLNKTPHKIENSLKIWDAGSGKLIKQLEGYTYPIEALTFSRDGKRLFTGSDDNLIRVWRTDNWQLLETIQVSYTVMSLRVSPDDQYLAAGLGNIATVWRIQER